MLAMPDPATAFIDPFCAVPTLSLTCTIAETGTKEVYTRDPRGIAQRDLNFAFAIAPAEYVAGAAPRLYYPATVNGVKVALEAIQCLGGNGYINEYATGRLLRDAKLYDIGAGTNEILFSGDLGRYNRPVLPDPSTVDKAVALGDGRWEVIAADNWGLRLVISTC